MTSIQMPITRDGAEIIVTVRLDYEPASRGRRDSFGVPEEPDCPADFSVVDAWYGSQEIQLTPLEELRAIAAAFADLGDRREAVMEAKWNDRRENPD